MYAAFVRGYKFDHRHGGIHPVSPAQRHAGDDNAILAIRREVYLRTGRRATSVRIEGVRPDFPTPHQGFSGSGTAVARRDRIGWSRLFNRNSIDQPPASLRRRGHSQARQPVCQRKRDAVPSAWGQNAPSGCDTLARCNQRKALAAGVKQQVVEMDTGIGIEIGDDQQWGAAAVNPGHTGFRSCTPAIKLDCQAQYRLGFFQGRAEVWRRCQKQWQCQQRAPVVISLQNGICDGRT